MVRHPFFLGEKKVSEILETVKVKHENGFMIINKSDFDEKIHVLFDEKPKTVQKPKTDVKE